MANFIDNAKKYLKGDIVLWMCYFSLAIVGLLVIYSATGTLAFAKRGGDTEFFLIRHFMFLGFGFVVMYITHLIDFRYFSRISQLLMAVSVILLILTLVFGNDINSAKRTLTIAGQSFQTSDIAKVALIMYIARFLTKKQEEITSFKSFGTILAIIVGVCALILPEDLSTALMLFSTSVLLLFIGRISIKHIGALVGIGGLFATIMVSVLLNISTDGWAKGTRIPTWKKRIEAFMPSNDKPDSYQTEHAKIAVATAGLFGKGPGGSTQRNFIPHPYSDFIYTVLVEEYGIFGGLVLIAIFLLILYRAIKIVLKSQQSFGAFLAVGIAISMVIQAFINMGVNVSLFPVTGLTIPFVSMGGTSVMINSFAFGVILSVSRDVQEIEELNSGNKSRTNAKLKNVANK